jgi:hypothetical protein
MTERVVLNAEIKRNLAKQIVFLYLKNNGRFDVSFPNQIVTAQLHEFEPGLKLYLVQEDGPVYLLDSVYKELPDEDPLSIIVERVVEDIFRRLLGTGNETLYSVYRRVPANKHATSSNDPTIRETFMVELPLTHDQITNVLAFLNATNNHTAQV